MSAVRVEPEATTGLQVDLGDLVLPTPVLAASGCFGTGKEMANAIDLTGIGAIVTKSVTLEPRHGLPVPRMAETDSGMLNAIGLQNPGVEEFLDKDGPFIESVGVPVFVSIAGSTVEEYARVAMMVSELRGVVAIEANISCPNVERRNQVFACHPDMAAEVVGTMSRLSRLPVFAKLTADVTNIVDVAKACVKAGARGLSLINTLLGVAIDVERMRPKLGSVTGGLSGPAIRPVAVRCIYQVSQALPDVPILGIGGVRTAEHALELMMAGAWAVQVGTANFLDPNVTLDVARGIGEFLRRRGLSAPSDVVRAAHPRPEPEAAAPASRGA